MKSDVIPPKARSQLKKLRHEIDSADKKLLRALAKRFKIVERIGKLKHKHKMDVIHNGRMKKMLKDRHDDSLRLRLDPKLIYEIFDLLHEASIDVQKKIVCAKHEGRKK